MKTVTIGMGRPAPQTENDGHSLMRRGLPLALLGLGIVAGVVVAQPPPAVATRERLPIVIAELTPQGFEPSAVRVPGRRFLLQVRNRTGRKNLNYSLSNQQRAIVGRQDHDWKDGLRGVFNNVFDLPSGSYELTERFTPSAVLTITVP